MTKINVAKLSNYFSAWQQCNQEWKDKREDQINEMLENLPNGSGIDNGVKFLWEESKPEKLIFSFLYHHLNENGYYDGWTRHKLVITPSFLAGYSLKITGTNRSQIKDYLHDLFNEVFTINHNYQIEETANA